MPSSYKVLGQIAATGSASSATAEALIAAGSGERVVSTITVVNRATTATTFRIAVRPANAAVANGQYIAFDLPIDGNGLITLTLGITLAAADTVSVFCPSSTSLTFNAFGTEIT